MGLGDVAGGVELLLEGDHHAEAGRGRIGKMASHALGQAEGERQVDGERTDIAKLVDYEFDAVQRILEASTEAVAVYARRGMLALRIVPRRNGAPSGNQDA